VSGNGSTPDAVGVLGGSFDPVHDGHLRIAHAARRWLGLTRVLLMPAAAPPHKAAAELTPARHRETMLTLALRGQEGLELSLRELSTGRVCYTIDTLREMRSGRPARIPVFILGTDSLQQITTWLSWRDLIQEFDLALIDRIGDDARRERDLDPEVAARIVDLDAEAAPAGRGERTRVGRGGRIFRLPMPPISISSSAIRARVRAGRDLAGLVPPSVARYIHGMGLYRQEKGH
jgi:nicotinate-nucleotide adenylyltransferase